MLFSILVIFISRNLLLLNLLNILWPAYARPMALTKDKLIIEIQNHLGMNKREAQQIVSRLFEIIKDTLSRGEDLLISGFGKFSVRQKKARRGRNPQTKQSLIIASRKVVVFKASGVLRQRINEGFKMHEEGPGESSRNKTNERK